MKMKEAVWYFLNNKSAWDSEPQCSSVNMKCLEKEWKRGQMRERERGGKGERCRTVWSFRLLGGKDWSKKREIEMGLYVLGFALPQTHDLQLPAWAYSDTHTPTYSYCVTLNRSHFNLLADVHRDQTNLLQKKYFTPWRPGRPEEKSVSVHI